ncbi:hypothetical protein B0H13DRAFT_1910747 [Mycena leptocephala]|nr:hypothetical protein B0H13DRAFT_1910747 [Mycena leptocephala]
MARRLLVIPATSDMQTQSHRRHQHSMGLGRCRRDILVGSQGGYRGVRMGGRSKKTQQTQVNTEARIQGRQRRTVAELFSNERWASMKEDVKDGPHARRESKVVSQDRAPHLNSCSPIIQSCDLSLDPSRTPHASSRSPRRCAHFAIGTLSCSALSAPAPASAQPFASPPPSLLTSLAIDIDTCTRTTSSRSALRARPLRADARRPRGREGGARIARVHRGARLWRSHHSHRIARATRGGGEGKTSALSSSA